MTSPSEPRHGHFLGAFVHAGAGIGRLVREEQNARVHLLATVLVVAAGAWAGLNGMEWALVVLAIASVWAVETLNTALERLCDVVSPSHHPVIGAAKDLAAGAVLVAAFGALVVGVLVFGPHLVR